jgi:hypothetical protein
MGLLRGCGIPVDDWVGKRHCRVLLLPEIRRRQCRFPTRLFWVGKRHCRVLLLPEIRRRQCRFPTRLFWVGKRHCRVLLLPEIRRRQCRFPTRLFWVGKRHCRLLYHVLKLSWINTQFFQFCRHAIALLFDFIPLLFQFIALFHQLDIRQKPLSIGTNHL